MKSSNQESASSSPCSSPSHASADKDDKPSPGSSTACPYRLLIVGGGPAGASILIRAIRLGLVDELFGAEAVERRDIVKHSNSNSNSNNNVNGSTLTGVASASDANKEEDPSSSSSPPPGSPNTAVVTPFLAESNSSGASSPQKPLSISTSNSNSNSPIRSIKYCPYGTKSDLIMRTAGVCLIDASPESSLGGGRLKDYIINSNTEGGSFASHVMREKPDNLPPESIKGSALEGLQGMECLQYLEAVGDRVAPLYKVGNFLIEVGKMLKEIFRKYKSTSNCYHSSKVISIQQFKDTAVDFDGWMVRMATYEHNSNIKLSEVVLFTRNIALATGGKQPMPTFTNQAHLSKVILSDDVCTEEGASELRRRLKLTSGTVSSAVKKKAVVIVGGSHSAFSAAWVCLNCIDVPPQQTATVSSTSGEVASLSSSSSSGTTTSVTSSVTSIAAVSTGSPSAPNSPTRGTASTNHSGSHSPTPTTASAAAATMIIPPPPRKVPVDLASSVFGPNGICILHRSNIRVFYESKRDADADKYTDLGHVNSTTGQIHAFGGIRGDAKDLWRSIRSGREQRLRLVQMRGDTNGGGGGGHSNSGVSNPQAQGSCANQSLVQKLFDDANVIIWACGYNTNVIPISGVAGENLSCMLYRGQVDVDDKARVLFAAKDKDKDRDKESAADICFDNLYGTGLGFGLKASFDNGDPDGSSGRADGVGVYLKRSASLILAGVLGAKKVYGGRATSWEERASLIRKSKFQQQQKDIEERSVSSSEQPLLPDRSLSPTNLNKRISTSSFSNRLTQSIGSSPMVKKEEKSTNVLTASTCFTGGRSRADSLPAELASDASATPMNDADRMKTQNDSVLKLSAPRAAKQPDADPHKKPTIYIDESRLQESIDRLSRRRAPLLGSLEKQPQSGQLNAEQEPDDCHSVTKNSLSKTLPNPKTDNNLSGNSSQNNNSSSAATALASTTTSHTTNNTTTAARRGSSASVSQSVSSVHSLEQANVGVMLRSQSGTGDKPASSSTRISSDLESAAAQLKKSINVHLSMNNSIGNNDNNTNKSTNNNSNNTIAGGIAAISDINASKKKQLIESAKKKSGLMTAGLNALGPSSKAPTSHKPVPGMKGCIIKYDPSV